jgi:hypothetical protein
MNMTRTLTILALTFGLILLTVGTSGTFAQNNETSTGSESTNMTGYVNQTAIETEEQAGGQIAGSHR